MMNCHKTKPSEYISCQFVSRFIFMKDHISFIETERPSWEGGERGWGG